MELWQIRGGRRLHGGCTVQGSKNATLPILAASIVCPCRVELQNVPQLSDVDTALEILRALGCRAGREGGRVWIDSRALSSAAIPHRLMEKMRASVFFLGALTARCGEAQLSLPGGCQLGKRPIDLHLAAMRQLGCEIEEEGGSILCRSRFLHGCELALPFPSVGATENIILTACAAQGETVLHGAAREPEITALCRFLRAMGADIVIEASGTVHIRGMSAREHVRFVIPPDRIVASTLCCAAAASGGDIVLRGADPTEISAVLYFLKAAGCAIIHNKRMLRLRAPRRLHAVGELCTAPYPGFPTDAQPLLMAALLRAEGTTRITETIFENRFRQVPQLRRLGADIAVRGRTAEICGVERLFASELTATDLRGGASMVLAGLCAEGETVVCDTGHITRGYDGLDRVLRGLGADVTWKALPSYQ